MIERKSTPPVAPRHILVVEDDPDVARAEKRSLERRGWRVSVASAADEAARMMMEGGPSVVLCDIHLPGASGVDLLSMIRTYDIDVPVLLITGNPTVETAIDAVQLGAVEYLTKPVDEEVLHTRIERAYKLRQLAALKRWAIEAEGDAVGPSDFFALGITFARALDQMFMVFQPIFDLRTRRVAAYEALMRSRESELAHPMAILDAARRLDRHQALGRRVRTLVDAALSKAPADVDLFVNLHSTDLLDAMLYERDAPLARAARRIVLEITERASLDSVGNPKQRARDLRALGYRLAVDDLGAGYAGLTSFTLLEPEVVKLDMGLVRNVHVEPMKRKLIDSIVGLCHGLGMVVVAEGIETMDELRALVELGCDLGQGFVLGRPDASFETGGFPAPAW